MTETVPGPRTAAGADGPYRSGGYALTTSTSCTPTCSPAASTGAALAPKAV